MRKHLSAFVAALALVAPVALAAHVPARVLVVSVDSDAAAEVAQRHGGNAKRIGSTNAYVVDLPRGFDEAAMRGRLTLDKRFGAVELDEIQRATFVPNDPSYPYQWHLPAINAAPAWDVTSGAGVTVAILDSGVQANHPDLAAHLVPGWNVYNNSSDTSDASGHGTAVAGVVAAAFNNATGVTGVAGNARIMPVRITAGDLNNTTTFSDMAAGIAYAADHGARVVNLSYMNAYRCESCISAAQYLQSKGGQLVVSANNQAIDEGVAAVPSVVVVSALDQSGALASFSSWGPMVTMSAPGVNIVTTHLGGGYNAPGYGAQGTSFATPIVAGVLALEFSANPSLTAQQAVSILTSTATDIGPLGFDSKYGYGKPNAYAAIVAASEFVVPPPPPPPPSTDTTPPTVKITAPWDGTYIGPSVKINASASDNVAVASITVYVDGTEVASSNSASLSFNYANKLASGSHVIRATAKDRAGNAAGASITVYRK